MLCLRFAEQSREQRRDEGRGGRRRGERQAKVTRMLLLDLAEMECCFFIMLATETGIFHWPSPVL
jgi:hypothetical protein